jgi:hypothetical protein
MTHDPRFVHPWFRRLPERTEFNINRDANRGVTVAHSVALIAWHTVCHSHDHLATGETSFRHHHPLSTICQHTKTQQY